MDEAIKARTEYHTAVGEHHIGLSKTHQALADCFSKAATGDNAPHNARVAELCRKASSQHGDLAQANVDEAQRLSECADESADKLVRSSGADGNPWDRNTEKADIGNPWERDIKVRVGGMSSGVTLVNRAGGPPLNQESADADTEAVDRFAR